MANLTQMLILMLLHRQQNKFELINKKTSLQFLNRTFFYYIFPFKLCLFIIPYNRGRYNPKRFAAACLLPFVRFKALKQRHFPIR